MTNKIRQAAEKCAELLRSQHTVQDFWMNREVADIIERAMRKLVDAPGELPTPASEEELVAALAKQLHHHLSAAQNLAWEEGDTCDDCTGDVRDIYLPIIRAYVAERVKEAVEAERESCIDDARNAISLILNNLKVPVSSAVENAIRARGTEAKR